MSNTQLIVRIVKKPASKVAYNRPNFFFFSIANQPKTHSLFHKNGFLRDFYIMTFAGTYFPIVNLNKSTDSGRQCTVGMDIH